MQTPQGTIIIESVDSEKDLGVVIDKSLSFDEHISSKISIANRNLGLIFRTFTFMDMFLNLYKSLVRPPSRICNQCHKKDMIATEIFQRRAGLLPKFKDKTYPERLKPSLEYGRDRADMGKLYIRS